jgi:hypothetical protein
MRIRNEGGLRIKLGWKGKREKFGEVDEMLRSIGLVSEKLQMPGGEPLLYPCQIASTPAWLKLSTGKAALSRSDAGSGIIACQWLLFLHLA